MRLCQAREQLRQVGQAEQSMDDIAAAAAMSRFHFIRQFKAVFGETPVQCRTRARLAKARELLVSSDASVTLICLTVGFSSLGSFSHLFAQRFGHSPSAFRRRSARSVTAASPSCMALLRDAWAQIRKNREATTDQAVLNGGPPVDVGATHENQTL